VKLLYGVVNLYLQGVLGILLFHFFDKDFLLHQASGLNYGIPLVVADLHFFSRSSASLYP
jgi:hypothetical protein